MAATLEAVLGRYAGASLVTAFPQVTPNGVGNQNLDLIQFVDEGGLVVLNVDYTGAVHNPASSATNGTRIGQFYTRLASGQSTTAYFADVFNENQANNDIIQIVNVGGNISYYLNYQGVATGS